MCLTENLLNVPGSSLKRNLLAFLTDHDQRTAPSGIHLAFRAALRTAIFGNRAALWSTKECPRPLRDCFSWAGGSVAVQ